MLQHSFFQIGRGRSGQIRLAAAAAVLTLVTAGAGFFLLRAQPGAEGYHFRAGDDRPPSDPVYQAALQRGREGEMAPAREQLLRLAAERRGTSTAAWSLYQAGLASRSLKDPAGQQAAWAELRTAYAAHPLAVRVLEKPAAPAAAREEGSDCGPRALAHVLELAGKPSDQARDLGPFYLPTDLVGSVGGWWKGHIHDANPMEIDADLRSGTPNPWLEKW